LWAANIPAFPSKQVDLDTLELKNIEEIGKHFVHRGTA
jgi:hypothetical protein